MQPADNTPAQTPTPESPKQGFWAKLFGKKPETPVVPPHESLAPAPQLDETTPEVLTQPTSFGVAPSNTNPIIGTPESKDLSAPDGNGDITSLPVAVPASIQSSVEGVEGTPPPLPVEQQPVSQPPVPEQLASPQPMPPVSSVPPVQPQPPQPGQQQ